MVIGGTVTDVKSPPLHWRQILKSPGLDTTGVVNKQRQNRQAIIAPALPPLPGTSLVVSVPSVQISNPSLSEAQKIRLNPASSLPFNERDAPSMRDQWILSL